MNEESAFYWVSVEINKEGEYIYPIKQEKYRSRQGRSIRINEVLVASDSVNH